MSDRLGGRRIGVIIITRGLAVADIADRTACDVRYSTDRPLHGIAVVSMSSYLFTVSN